VGKRKAWKIAEPLTSEFVSGRFQHLLDVHKSALKQIDELKLENKRLKVEGESVCDIAELRSENVQLRRAKNETDDKLGEHQRQADEELRRERQRFQDLLKKRDQTSECLAKRTSELKRTTESLEESREKTVCTEETVDEYRNKICRLETDLEQCRREIERHAPDPEERTLSDLGEIYAQIFALNSEDINHYEMVNDNKQVRGVSLWFELLVKEALLNLDKRLRGAIGCDLDWFVNFMFKNDVIIYFCRYLGAFEAHQQIQGKNATRFDRKARADNLHQQRLTFLSVLYNTALTDSL
jgi:myosin heavy subunit